MRRFLRWLAVLVIVAIAFAVGTYSSVLVRPPLVVGQDAVTDAASATLTPVLDTANGARTIVVQPPSGTARKDTLVIVYPGGLVRPQAYEWLARALAVRGYTTVIPEFSFDLAVTDTGRATALIERYAEGRRVVLAGHSLGGAMAAQYLADEQKAGRRPVAGLVLMGAYPPDGADLAGATLKAVSLRGENDLVADPALVVEGLKRLPAGTELVQIEGAVHSFFGRYGPQAGDGVPTVDRAAAETRILETFVDFLTEL
ncbi:MAG: alpha/beta hydrolase fold domain-containing protein [Propionibacteriaceae bacterium]|nr:alpha/beta hydrolase fold domain-containing protein [Propionibacteriaceae bacterium]